MITNSKEILPQEAFDITDKDRNDVFHFTHKSLIQVEKKLQKKFEKRLMEELWCAREGMHMYLIDELSFRLLCSRNWTKKEIKEFMCESVDEVYKNLVEIEKEEETVGT